MIMGLTIGLDAVRRAPAVRPLRRVLWLGMAAIWLYWTSFFWLALVFYLLGLKGPYHPLVVAMLDAFTWQPILLVGSAAQRVLRYPGALIFFTPEVGAVVGAVLTSLVWWAGLNMVTRMRRKSKHTAA